MSNNEISWSFRSPYLKYKVWLQSLDAPDDMVNLSREKLEELRNSFHSLPPNASPEKVDGVFMQFFDSFGGEKWRDRKQDWYSGMKEGRNKDFFFESFEELFEDKNNPFVQDTLLYYRYHNPKIVDLNVMLNDIRGVFESDIEKYADRIIVRDGIYDWETVFQLAQDEWINDLTCSMKNDLADYHTDKIPDWHTWNSRNAWNSTSLRVAEARLEEMVAWKIKLELCNNQPGPVLLKMLLYKVRKNYSDRYIWITCAWLAALGAPDDIVFLPDERAKQLNDLITTFCSQLPPHSSLEQIDGVIVSFFFEGGLMKGMQDRFWFQAMMREKNKSFFFEKFEELFNPSRRNISISKWHPKSNNKLWTLYSDTKNEFHAYARRIFDQDLSPDKDWVRLFFSVREAWMRDLKQLILSAARRFGETTPWSTGVGMRYENYAILALKWKIRLDVCVFIQDDDFLQEFQGMARSCEMLTSPFQSKPVCKICSKPI